MAVAAILNRGLGAFATCLLDWLGAWCAGTHGARIKPVCEKREMERATDGLHLSHFPGRSGVGEERARCRPYLLALLWLGSNSALGIDATRQDPAVLPNPIVAQSIGSLSATRERPIFSPTRRPPALPAAAPAPIVRRADPAPPSPPPDVVLLGVVIGPDTADALVHSESPDKTLRVRIGDDIGGWKVSRIEQHELVLSLADRSAIFTIFNGARSSASPSVGPSLKPVQSQPLPEPQQAAARMRRAARDRECPNRC
jgi:general secretion pathway protein N